MNDEQYTIKEVMENRFAEMRIHLNEIKNDGKETKGNVAIQNGRVRKLEDWSIEAQKLIEATAVSVNLFKSYQDKLTGGYKVVVEIAVVVPILCTTVFGLYLKVKDNEIDQKIQKAVAQSLQDNVESVEYAK